MTLTYLFWELAKNPEWQDKLRRELRTQLAGKTAIVPDYNDVANLPVLDAVIQEALRLHPAAPASLPRDTPPGGRVLNGIFVPQGVSCPKHP
jgi:cytochrome P450